MLRVIKKGILQKCANGSTESYFLCNVERKDKVDRLKGYDDTDMYRTSIKGTVLR